MGNINATFVIVVTFVGVTRPSGAHGQGTVRGPKTNIVVWVNFGCGPPGPSGPLDIVHPVHPLATPLVVTFVGTILVQAKSIHVRYLKQVYHGLHVSWFHCQSLVYVVSLVGLQKNESIDL